MEHNAGIQSVIHTNKNAASLTHYPHETTASDTYFPTNYNKTAQQMFARTTVSCR